MTPPVDHGSDKYPNGSLTIELSEVIAEIDDLPSLPAIVTELLNSLDDEDIDINQLARKVSHDQALTAKTLRYANSSFYAPQAKVATLPQAIALLGIDNVKNLIMAAALTGCFPERQCPGFDFKAFWKHSMATAVCAQLLGREVHATPDYAFTAGLLHDLGRLVLVTSFPQHYASAIRYSKDHDCGMLEAERAVLGVDHTAAGQALAERWRFSETMQHAILGHHDPSIVGNGALVCLVHIANSVVHALDITGDADDLVPSVSEDAWSLLNISEECFMRAFRGTILHVGKLGEIL